MESGDDFIPLYGSWPASWSQVTDSAGYYDGTNVETVLAEVGLELLQHNLGGWEDATKVALSTNSGTPPTFTLTFTDTVYYWCAGVRYSKTGSENIQIDNTSGMHILYYDGSTLSKIVNPSESQVDEIIVDKCIAMIIYWNANSNTAPILAYELHGLEMSGETHHWIHDNVGAVWKEGGTVSGYILSTGSDAALTFEVSDCEFYDEDYEIEIEHAADATGQYEQILNTVDAQIPVLYRDATDQSWVEQAASIYPYIFGGNDRPSYQDAADSYIVKEVGSNEYCNYFLVATNDWQLPIKMMPGTAKYTTKALALSGAPNEIVDFGALPGPEFIVLYRFLLQGKAGGGTYDCQIIDVTDYRGATISGASAVASDHGTLSGLADDDHTQYILHSLADAANDFLVASADDIFVKKTLAETGAILEGDINHDNLVGFEATEHVAEASIDHGTIAGLGDDDHTQYILADGSRDINSGGTNEVIRLISTDNRAEIAFEDNDTVGSCGVENTTWFVASESATIFTINLGAPGGSMVLDADAKLTLTAPTGEPGLLEIWADAGEDNADKWKIEAEDGGAVLNISSYSTGSWVDLIEVTPATISINTDVIGQLDETVPEVIQQDAEPGTTYPGLIWVDTDADPAGTNVTSFIKDDDGDTMVQCEESADEDIIRFDCGGTEVLTIADETISMVKSFDGGLLHQIINAGATTGAYSEFRVANTAGSTAHSLRTLCLGTAFTTNGGFVQDSGVIIADISLSGGLSLIAREENASLRLYSGGLSQMSLESDSEGRITKPLQPGFLTYVEGSMANISTGSTTITFNTHIGSQHMDDDFNEGTYTFTAPVDGVYHFDVGVRVQNMDTAANYYYVSLFTTNRDYYCTIDPKYTADLDFYTFNFSVAADMEASDTAHVYINQNGGASQTDVPDSNPATGLTCWFSGYLLG